MSLLLSACATIVHAPPSQVHTPHIPPFNKNLDLAPKGGDALELTRRGELADTNTPADISSVGGPCEEYRDPHEVDVRDGGPISPIGGVSAPKCK